VSAPDKFRDRLVQLTLTRLAGVAIAAIGFGLIVVERLPYPVHALGILLVLAGLGWVLLAQRRLRRRWDGEDA